MGLFGKKDRTRKTREAAEEALISREAEAQPSIGQLHMSDDVQRKEYIDSCLQRMFEGALEVEQLKTEYNQITGQLYDLDTIASLRDDQKARVKKLALRITDCETRQKEADDRDSKMSDQDFSRMERFGEEYPLAVRKYEDAEDYHKRIKGDLRRLDNEREAFYIREDELEKTLAGTHDLSIICLAALCTILAVLFILQTVFHFQVVYGYMAAILLTAVAIVLLYVRNSNAAKELKTVESSINRLILLQNTVKIRYVNNRNLLDYYELKYGVRKASELKKMAVRYETEKEERKRLSDTERELALTQQELLRLLNDLALRIPSRWVRTPKVLYDKEAEQALRAELKSQRIKLRSQMDYNQDKVITKAKDEIKRLARKYPRYDSEISAQVDAFIREKGISF